MSASITEYRTAILRLLDDANQERFTDDQVDAGLRTALELYTAARPLVRTYSVEGSGEHQIVLPADTVAMQILEVFLDDESDPPTAIPFKAVYRDEQWVVETLGQVIAATQSLLIAVSMPHTIDGLDGAAGTTIATGNEAFLQAGAAGFALIQRAASRVELINLQPDVEQRLVNLGIRYLGIFEKFIRIRSKPAFTRVARLRADKF